MSNDEAVPAQNVVVRFAERVQAMLHDGVRTQLEQIEQAAGLVARAVERGGLVHTLGTGHSHLLAEEIYSRAGGLLPVNVVESAPLMLHEDALASGEWERVSGIAHIMLEHAGIDPSRDVLIVISNSGRNSVPVEAAEWARTRQVPVVALTSCAHSRAETPLAPSGKKLYEVADVVLDNLGQPGDAVMPLAHGVRTGATSDIIGAFLLHAVVLRAIELLLERGQEPPVLVSGNVSGAREANQRMIEHYPGRLAPAYERRRARR
jgi:uncharacterized phosphosugar-binding protein